jgi:hypothetical protein
MVSEFYVSIIIFSSNQTLKSAQIPIHGYVIFGTLGYYGYESDNIFNKWHIPIMAQITYLFRSAVKNFGRTYDN